MPDGDIFSPTTQTEKVRLLKAPKHLIAQGHLIPDNLILTPHLRTLLALEDLTSYQLLRTEPSLDPVTQSDTLR